MQSYALRAARPATARGLASALALVALGSAGAARAAGRAPDPEQALACLASLEEAVRDGSLPSQDLSRWFAPPPPPLGDSAAGRSLDRERLLVLLRPDGALGRVLGRAPPVAALVPGPDYLRVVLATSPHLSFLLARGDGQVRIRSWEKTWCADCREPARFVVDLIARAGQGDGPLLVPGLDLRVPAAVAEPDEPGGDDWRWAWEARNRGAGYLRWLLAGAEVLGQDLHGVQVAFRDHVETWPVAYEEGAWVLDYAGLPADSPLRLEPADLDTWSDREALRAASMGWWAPESGRVDHGGRRVASDAVAVGRQTPAQRWLVAIERPDGLVAAMFGFDLDGGVGLRLPLPIWPDPDARPVRRWASSWAAAVSPQGDRLLLAGAGRWWIVDLATGEVSRGNGAGLGEVGSAAWSRDGGAIALGDFGGNLALFDATSPSPVAVGSTVVAPDGARSAVVDLAFAPGDGSLLVAAAVGRVEAHALPGLEPLEDAWDVCCGDSGGLAVDAGRDRAYVACGEGCAPGVAVIALHALADEGSPDGVAPESTGGMLSLSPDGRWLVAGSAASGAAAVLLRAEDMSPEAVFSDIALLDVAWDEAGTSLLALREDGSAVLWAVADLLGGDGRERLAAPGTGR